jgi:hypothetical protein
VGKIEEGLGEKECIGNLGNAKENNWNQLSDRLNEIYTKVD